MFIMYADLIWRKPHALGINMIFTGRNEVVAKVMFLLVSVILSTGGSTSLYAEIPLPRRPPGRRYPQRRYPPGNENPLAKETPSRPTPKGEIEGGLGPGPHPRGKLRGSDPGPHPIGKLRGIRSRPTPKGDIEGDQIQVHTQGGNWRGSDPAPPPQEADSGIQSMSGRYASYCSAFLYALFSRCF